MLNKISEKKFEDNILRELSHKRFQYAKQRLKDFLIKSDMCDIEEKDRLFSYFCHRFASYVQIVKESARARRVQRSRPQSGGTIDSNPDKLKMIEFSRDFTLKKREYECGDFDENEAAQETAKQLKEYKKAKNLPETTKIYVLLSVDEDRYGDLREAFKKYDGWVEHDWEKVLENDKFDRQDFDFLYSVK